MHPLVPAFILDNFAAGKLNGSFTGAAMFVDLSGFSAMTDALMEHGQEGAEALAEIMRRVFSPMLETAYGQGGFVARSAGDAITVLFPAGEQDKDDNAAAQHGLAAAWRIQEHMRANTECPTVYGSFRVSAKIGLASGQVHWGILTSPGGGRAVYYFEGAAIDACAAAEQQAAAGEIILQDAFYRLVEPLAQAAPRGPARCLNGVLGELTPPCAIADHAPDPHILSLFYPPQALALERSGEFRQVVSLFINLPSVRTETQLAIFIDSLFAMQDRYEGFLNSLDFGDKGATLLLFWGAPVAYENDIQRALDFTLDLQTATSIPIRAGVTYRISHAGFIGGRLHVEYTCFGRGVNLAARFMAAAPRGEIWVDEFIAARAAQGYEIEPAGEKRFKGFTLPQKVFVLLERKEQAQHFFSGALAGRQAELQTLQRFVQPIFAGACPGLLVVTGEPGIGKSRLVYDFLAALQDPAAPRLQVFTGQTDEILRSSLNPFKYWLRRRFGIAAAQGEARSKRNFNRTLDELISGTPDPALAAELDRTRSFLGALLGLHWPDSLYETLDAPGRYENTFIALAALLQAESLLAPTILLLEDIQWLDGDSLAFLGHLGRVLAAPAGRAAPLGLPLAILATSRDRPPELEGLPVSELALPGLAPEQLRLLAGDLLGAPPGPALLSLLEARAEGSPFYAAQILRYLQEHGLLALEAGAWQPRPGQMDALPVDVNALLVARLDHLPAPMREVVQTASVLGREFDARLLCHMVHCADDQIPSEVAAAEHEAIWKAWGEQRYIFTHALLRDAAYQMQLQARRRTLHGLALTAYEKLAGEAPPAEHYGALAYHAGQAGKNEQARRYLHLQGRAALDAYQNNLAVDCFTRALSLTPAGDAALRSELLLLREQVYQVLALNTGRAADLDELTALLPTLDDARLTLQALLRQARLQLDLGRYPAADDTARQAADLAVELDELEQAVVAYRYLAASAMRQGRLIEAAALARQSVELAERCASPIDQGRSLNSLGMIATEQGDHAAAQAAFQRALEIGRQVDDLRFVGTPLNNLGMLATRQWDYLDGQVFFEQSLQASEKIGDRIGEAIALGNLGFIAGSLGDYRRALRLTARYLRISRETDNPYLEANALINQGAWAGAQGDFAAAGEGLSGALELTRRTGDRSGEAWALTYLGHNALEQGELEAAAQAYAGALAIRAELNQPDLACEPRAGLARLALQRGEPEAAYEYVAAILAHLDGGGSLQGADQPLRVELTCYQALQRRGDPRARPLLAAAHQALQERAAKIADAPTRQGFLNQIAYHREILAAWAAPA